MALRIIFMGTPDFAVPTLRALRARGHEIVAVYTREPRRAGRGMELQPSPVERAARALGLPVFTPRSLKTNEACAEFAAHGADAAVVVAYGMILPRAILDAVPLGCFNLHASLLPRWRGAAPINRAVMAGDTQTGVMVMKMDEGLDTGNIAMTARLDIDDSMNAGDVHDALAPLGAELMADAMDSLAKGALPCMPQAHDGVTYAHKLDKNEARIDWTKSARAVLNHCRGLSPFPGAWFEIPGAAGSARVKVLRCALAHSQGSPGEVLDDHLTIACGDGALRILQLQRAGKLAMQADEFLRGTPLSVGARVT